MCIPSLQWTFVCFLFFFKKKSFLSKLRVKCLWKQNKKVNSCENSKKENIIDVKKKKYLGGWVCFQYFFLWLCNVFWKLNANPGLKRNKDCRDQTVKALLFQDEVPCLKHQGSAFPYEKDSSFKGWLVVIC